VTITLANIIRKSFGEEYEERKVEEEQEAQAAAAASGGLQEGLGADGTISIPLFGELFRVGHDHGQHIHPSSLKRKSCEVNTIRYLY